MRAFEAAARHLSFQKAAAELGVTSTAISHQIRLLEECCGQALFRRRPRPLQLTSAGQDLFPVLRNGFDAFAAVLETLSASTEARSLRVTTTNAFASRWLVPRLPQWRKAHPDIPLEVIGTDKLLDLRSGEADVAIRYTRTMPADSGAQEMFRDRFFPMCSAALLAAGRPILRPGDLRQHPLIHFDWLKTDAETPTWRRWWAAARSIDSGLPEIANVWDLSFREETHAIEAILAGQGIAICSDVVLARELASGALVKAHELSLPGFGFYLVQPPDHPRQAVIARFSEWIRSAL
ncbi:LysR substrate-binding domain-containing protein [Pseudaminobacter soli (ex Li et al. 2025)]|uniref:LysR substrate-binding domain-containing protein n=1 Tax=Pseudaminobacter soli (ex Li et al. 2025) TaxID=1295366 RepID=UPI0024767EBE|nr:LysR substrate-binding domain-containing protein [Mesorhizobium soli]